MRFNKPTPARRRQRNRSGQRSDGARHQDGSAAGFSDNSGQPPGRADCADPASRHALARQVRTAAKAAEPSRRDALRGRARRERGRPLIGTLETIPGRRVRAGGQRGPFRPNVDLLAPVGLAAGVLVAGAVVAAKMRGVHHFNGELVLLGQGKKSSGDLQRVMNEAIVDPVTNQVEEAHTARRCSQIF
jgi:hypothetical protein